MSLLEGKRFPPIACPEMWKNIFSTLFPADVNCTSFPTMHVNPDEVPVVANEEILDVAKRFIEKMTPRLDRIPNIALK